MQRSSPAHEFHYLWNGDKYRVIVVGDVVSLPGYSGSPGWSLGGFGPSISVEWLLHSGGLPGSKAKKIALANMIVQALDSIAQAERAAKGESYPAPPLPPRAA